MSHPLPWEATKVCHRGGGGDTFPGGSARADLGNAAGGVARYDLVTTMATMILQ